MSVLECTACKLSPHLPDAWASRVVPSSGPSDARIAVVGEAPGQREDQEGVGFTGRAGAYLKELLSLAGYDKDACRLMNVVKCWPRVKNGKQQKPGKKEIRTCSELWLLNELREMRPDLIIALGAVPLSVFFPDDGIGDVHGQIRDWEGIRVATLYHPAAGLHAPKLRSVIENDFRNLPTKLEARDVPPFQAVQVEGIPEGLGDFISLDLETTDLRPRFAQVVGVAFTGTAESGYYWAVPTVPPELTGRRWVGHNAVYELSVLLTERNRGCLGSGVDRQPPLYDPPHDTMILAALLGKPKGLKALALSELGIRMTQITALLGPAGKHQKTMDEVPEEEVTEYAAGDAVSTFRLFPILRKQLDRDEEALYELERQLLPVTARVNTEGIRLDGEAITRAREEIEGKLEERINSLRRFIGNPEFNPRSPQQVVAVLNTRDSSEATLLDEGSDLALGVVGCRELMTLMSRYIGPLERMFQDCGRAYGSFNQVGTDTGRYSASGWRIQGSPWGINLQTIPTKEEGKLIRACFIPDAGCEFLEVDESQIELRVGSVVAPEPSMQSAFRAGRDIHNEMMALSGLVDRRAAKILNFGMGYEPFDHSAVYVVKRLFLQEGIRIDESQAAGYVRMYRQAWPALREYYNRISGEVMSRGYVQTHYGRKLRIQFARGNDKITRRANEDVLKKAINMPWQGTAADIFKMAWRAFDKGRPDWLVWKVPVHDSWLSQIPIGRSQEALGFMREKYAEAIRWDVPLKLGAKVGPNWAEMKEIE